MSPGVGEYEIKYLERQNGVYLPRLGRNEDANTFWRRRHSHDPGGKTCTKATAEYLRLHRNQAPSLSFAKQVGRVGMQRLRYKDSNLELAPIHAHAKGAEEELQHAEAYGHNVGGLVDPLRAYRYDDVQKNVQDLEVEIKERMQRVNLLLPKKPKAKS